MKIKKTSKMGKVGLKFVWLFVYLAFMYVVGSLIFTKGFLLKRDVIEQNSSCRVDFARYWDGETHGAEGCWLHRRFDKAIIIIIDALRFDFLVPSKTVGSQNLPYSNKLKVVHELLSKKPMNARAYKFVADPPTTTLQRLKGLTTGSLPTFVDAGSNFASSEIHEDNFVDQIVKKGKKITFMGDDTWMDLFPGRFNRAYPYPSFNVKDLHTVDNGILQHIYTEMARPDWDVTIAHFLGVDHCGHRYGPNHPAMAEKLEQMNQVIKNVTSLMDESTILFVFGDHGMTQTGDHGGDSQDELNAGLFVYSPAQITSSKYVPDHYKTIWQVDFVPTISLLLGLPIPFSNLGHIINDLLNYCSWSKDSHIKEVYHSVESLRLNAKQIDEYITQYAQQFSDLPTLEINLMHEQLDRTEKRLQRLATDLFVHNFAENAHGQLHEIEREYHTYIDKIKGICQQVWVKFDLLTMGIGMLVLAVALLVNVYIITMNSMNYSDTDSEEKGMGTVVIVVMASGIFVAYCIIQVMFLEGISTSFMAFILGSFDFAAIGIIIWVLKRSKNTTEESNKDEFKKTQSLVQSIKNSSYFSVENMLSCLSIFMTFFFTTTNSFTVYNDSMSLFLCQTFLFTICLTTIQTLFKNNAIDSVKSKQKSSKTYDLLKSKVQSCVIIVLLTLSCGMLLRLSAVFRGCREEQVNCELSPFLSPLSSIGQTVPGSKNVRYFFSTFCLILTFFMPWKWLCVYGNLNGTSGSAVCGRYLLPVGVVATVLHWALQGLPGNVLDSMSVWQQVLLPQTVYVVIVISVVMLLWDPLCIYIIPKQQAEFRGQGDSLVRNIYNHLKFGWTDGDSGRVDQEDSPVVFGLATVYTAAILYIGSFVLLLLCLLLGDGLSPSILTAVMALVMFLELFTVAVRVCRDKDLLLPGIMMISLMTTNYFYATGHQTTIPAIRFEAAFVGFHGDWENKVLPGILIHLNMFASEVFFTLISCLLILWPCSSGFVAGYLFNKKGDESLWKGDYVMYDHHSTFISLLVKLMSIMFIISGVKIFANTIAMTLLRRHLMMWKVFAPSFVFTAMSCFTVFAVLILMYLLIIRVHNSLTTWHQGLNSKKM